MRDLIRLRFLFDAPDAEGGSGGGAPAADVTTPDSAAAAPPAAEPRGSFADALANAAPTLSRADHEAALATERQKWEAESADYQWIRDLQPDQRQSIRNLVNHAVNSPVEAARELLAIALQSQNPAHIGAARSLLGRLLASATPGGAPATTPAAPAVPAEPPGPDIPATRADGTQVMLYSDKRLAEREAWFEKRMLAQFDERIKPIEAQHKTFAEQAAESQREQQALGMARDTSSYFKTLPGFKEHQNEIVALFNQRQVPDEQAVAALYDAYVRVVVPKLQQQGSTASTQDAARRAAASTGRPVTAAATRPAPAAPISFADRLAQQMAANKGRRTGS